MLTDKCKEILIAFNDECDSFADARPKIAPRCYEPRC